MPTGRQHLAVGELFIPRRYEALSPLSSEPTDEVKDCPFGTWMTFVYYAQSTILRTDRDFVYVQKPVYEDATNK
jgi:hypothetical protein